GLLNASFDVVVCTQVAEYVADIDRVFSEVSRPEAERPNCFCCDGLAHCPVVFRQSNTHVGSHDIMGRAFRPSAPANVHGEQVYQGGISFRWCSRLAILNLQFDDDNYSRGLARIVRNFVAGKNDISADDLKDWHDELERLSEAGRYFFSSNRYIFKASKPSSNA
ncbi:MAG: SAM-dependent methyltransferase, partial [Pseudolabrys sp.]